MPSLDRPFGVLLLLCLLAGTGQPACVAGVGELTGWPQWLGPNRNGVIRTSKPWRVDWSESGLEFIWKKQLGTGFSPASIHDGRVYSMGRLEGYDVVYCLDAESGAEIWRFAYESPLFDDRHEGGPAGAAAVSSGGVYTLSRAGLVLCLDPDSGAEKWRKDLSADADIKVPLLGFTSSPLVDDGQVVVDVGRVIALDCSSGEIRWRTEKFVESYSSPGAPFLYQDALHLPVLNGTGLTLVRLSDGTVPWTLPWKTFNYDTNTSTPVVHAGRAFFSSGYDRGCALATLGAASEEAVVWEKDSFRSRYNTHLLVDGMLYGFDLQNFQCIDFDTGDLEWSEDMGALGCQILVDDHLIVWLEHGEAVLVEPSGEEYREKGRTHVLGGRCWSPPSFVDGLLYARNSKGEMICVSARSD